MNCLRLPLKAHHLTQGIQSPVTVAMPRDGGLLAAFGSWQTTLAGVE
jgi:hypothetical protein